MAPPTALEAQDLKRDAEFKNALHGKTGQDTNYYRNILGKNKEAQKEAVDEYFKHWDNKDAVDETPEIREVRQRMSKTIDPSR